MNKSNRKSLFSSAAALAPANAAGPLHQAPQPWVSEAEANWWHHGSWLTGMTLLLCALALCLPGVPVPDSYHAFADQVT
ncbi:MAG: hypothetical protein Q4A28_01690 [Brachymonas sp.]|nr:hypothetical protein [Brachymonas sp.]